MKAPKLIRPSPKPLPLPNTPALSDPLEKFLPIEKRTQRLRSTVLKACQDGCFVWTGKAVVEFGLTFKKKPVRTVKDLMLVEPLHWRRGTLRDVKLGIKSIRYLNALLSVHELSIGAAVPPNDYD